jgi:hypothetical protein
MDADISSYQTRTFASEHPALSKIRNAVAHFNKIAARSEEQMKTMENIGTILKLVRGIARRVRLEALDMIQVSIIMERFEPQTQFSYQGINQFHHTILSCYYALNFHLPATVHAEADQSALDGLYLAIEIVEDDQYSHITSEVRCILNKLGVSLHRFHTSH